MARDRRAGGVIDHGSPAQGQARSPLSRLTNGIALAKLSQSALELPPGHHPETKPLQTPSVLCSPIFEPVSRREANP